MQQHNVSSDWSCILAAIAHPCHILLQPCAEKKCQPKFAVGRRRLRIKMRIKRKCIQSVAFAACPALPLFLFSFFAHTRALTLTLSLSHSAN